MASHIWHALKSARHNTVILEGSFQFDGVNQPTAIKGNSGLVPTRGGAGLFNVFIPMKLASLSSAILTLHLAAATDLLVQVTSFDLNRGVTDLPGVVSFRVINAAGAEVDVAADANNRVSYVFTLRDTSR